MSRTPRLITAVSGFLIAAVAGTVPAGAQSFLPSTISADASIIFRDYNVSGVEASGAHNVSKSDLRQWGNAIGVAINSPTPATIAIGSPSSDTNPGYSVEAFPTSGGIYSAPAFNFNDQATAGFNFSDSTTHFAMAIDGSSAPSGTGSYEALVVYQYCINRDDAAYCTGAQEEAIGLAGTTNRGNYTGNNAYVLIPSGMTGLNSAVGQEINTEIHSNIFAKEAIRIADLGAGSDGCTSDVCAIIDAVKASGAGGFTYGLRFNADTDGDDTGFPVKAGGTLWKSTTTSKQLYAGIDWGHMLGGFSTGAAIILPNNASVSAENSGHTAIFQLISSTTGNVVCLACSGQTTTVGGAIELQNNVGVVSYNAAHNADISLMFLGADNQEYIGYGGTQVTFGGNVITGSVLSIYGTWASQPSDLIFGDSTNGTDAIIYRPTGSRDLRIDTATAGDIVKFSQAGLIQLFKYGAGTLTTDSSGNVTASSDERLKDITGGFTRGIADLAAMDPAVMYRWKREEADGVDAQYAGWTAQGVAKGIPEAVSTGPDGYLTLAERPILAAVVNGLLDLNTREEALQAANDNLRAEFVAYRAAHP